MIWQLTSVEDAEVLVLRGFLPEGVPVRRQSATTRPFRGWRFLSLLVTSIATHLSLYLSEISESVRTSGRPCSLVQAWSSCARTRPPAL